MFSSKNFREREEICMWPVINAFDLIFSMFTDQLFNELFLIYTQIVRYIQYVYFSRTGFSHFFVFWPDTCEYNCLFSLHTTFMRTEVTLTFISSITIAHFLCVIAMRASGYTNTQFSIHWALKWQGFSWVVLALKGDLWQPHLLLHLCTSLAERTGLKCAR